MRKFFGILVAAAFCALAMQVNAQTIGNKGALSWDRSTKREDGTALTPAEIEGYRIYYVVGSNAEGIAGVIPVEVGAGTNTVLELSLMPRPEPYVVHFAIAAKAKNSGWGRLSTVVSQAFRVDSTSPAEPPAPTSIKMELTCGDAPCTIVPVPLPIE